MDKTGAIYREVNLWMRRNAREFELALWHYYFENGSADDVVFAMSAYQNADGGFGNGFERDNLNPASTPYTTARAIYYLSEVGFPASSKAMTDGILKYLESEKDFDADGWRFSTPSNDAWPCAPWMNYNEKSNKVENIGVTATMCAFVLMKGQKGTPFYQKCLALGREEMKNLSRDEYIGDMGFSGLMALAEAFRVLKIDGYDDQTARARFQVMVDHAIVRDPEKWAQYGARPSAFIDSPDSPFYSGNEEIVKTELDYLLNTRPEGGVWGINWLWFGKMDKYAAEFAVSENYWKALKAIEKMRFLDAFGRI